MRAMTALPPVAIGGGSAVSMGRAAGMRSIGVGVGWNSNLICGDMSITTTLQNQLNGITTGASFLAHDIFSSWGKITRSGPYGLVIVDLPSYQKGSFVATKDYARLMRRLPDLLAPGGHALLCLNAPELGVDFLQDQMRELAPELGFVERVANPAVFADVQDGRALKVLVYQAPELPGQGG
mgnify:CR=1 FL=1